MIQADYHMHSSFSGDSKSPMEEMILSSIKNGLTEICFTEHHDPKFPYIIPSENGLFDLDFDSYREKCFSLQEKYADRLRIRFGLELGIQPHILDDCNQIPGAYPFDFVIASSHVCKHKDPYYPSYYDGISIKEGIRDYFEEILQNVSDNATFSEYNVYGHLDYVVRYIPSERSSEYTYRFNDFSDLFEAILKQIILNGKGIELNTSGLAKSIQNTNPCPEIIRLYKELGGEIITVGADAHIPENVAYGFDTAERILLEAGFKHYCTFEKRKPVFHDL